MKHRLFARVFAIAAVATVTWGTDRQVAIAQAPIPVADAPATIADVAGTVVETMNAGQYTYVLLDDGTQKIWAAGPQAAVAVGDKVVLSSGTAMRNFESKSLGRTFDVVYFVPAIQVKGGKAASGAALPAHGMAPNHAAQKSTTEDGIPGHAAPGLAPATVDLSNIKKAAGGQTVGELFAGKADLAGKEVIVRGRVVKFTRAVMGKNWIHIQDGSGSAGSNDLTISTTATAAVGDTVLVRGKLGTDKDLGFGYHYDIIIEDGSVTVE